MGADQSPPPTPNKIDHEDDLRRLEERFAELEKPLQPSDFEIEMKSRLSELYEDRLKLTGGRQDINIEVGSKESLFRRLKVSIFALNRPKISSTKSDQQAEDLERVLSEIRFYEEQRSNHIRRREAERIRKLREVGRSIADLRDRIRNRKSTDEALADDPSFAEPMLPR